MRLNTQKLMMDTHLAIKPSIIPALSCIIVHFQMQAQKSYWINTSANGLIGQLIFQEHMIKISDIQALIDGKSVWKNINENLVMKELTTFRDAVWNLLLFSGYLTISEKRPDPDNPDNHICCLKIPNIEIRNYFISEMKKLKATQDTLIVSENQAIQKVFISYNHKDIAFVEQLKQDLEKSNIQLIIDIDSMKFGDDNSTNLYFSHFFI